MTDKPASMGVDEAITAYLAPYKRIDLALQALDQRASEILALHAAIEREVDLALARSLPAPDRLRSIGFGHKLSLLAALTPLDQDQVDSWYRPAYAFNELRNAVAHGENAAQITKRIQAVGKALPGARDAQELHALAGVIANFVSIRSGPMTPLQQALARGLDIGTPPEA